MPKTQQKTEKRMASAAAKPGEIVRNRYEIFIPQVKREPDEILFRFPNEKEIFPFE